ncbi:PIR Superfamily Protein [Plasmodium ovale curtisi]|uniref:PIR Superfamily Protein n=1 Tax=Plasmodium ovale curtisi TaxID=864141 RepID=A0A1A8X9M4_PLAOA|nr:PIR Superfamily Protein [Plasmodium ovale curtisi]
MVTLGTQEINLDNYVKNCPLFRFIKKLDTEPEFNRYPPDANLESIEHAYKAILQKVSSILYRNYYTLTAFQGYIKSHCCSYLNYWLDSQKEKYVKDQQLFDDELWQIIENSWNELERKNNPKSHCKRKAYGESAKKTKNKMELMIYCTNRDYFKDRCTTQAGYISQKKTYCTALNKYIDKYYRIFVNNDMCLKYKDRYEDYEFHFSEECTLYDITNTFPDYYIEEGKLLKKKTPKKSISQCEIAPNPTHDLKNLYVQSHEPSNEESPPLNDAPWESVLYVGLTLMGFLSFSVILHKYTPIGSLLRSFITKKREINRYIDEDGEKQLLEYSSDFIDNNSENTQYNFSYQHLQN